MINAIIPILFIFTPPLAGFLADKLGNFRVLLSILTALGGRNCDDNRALSWP